VRDGALGLVVNPGDPAAVRGGIAAALKMPRGTVPEGLREFDLDHFNARAHAIVDKVIRPSARSFALPVA
jgi:hypothetical protein